jgi:hypothetical protein
VKDHLGVDAQVSAGRERPGDRHHLLSGSLADIEMATTTAFRLHHREMPGLVQHVARVRKPRRVDHEGTVMNRETGDKGRMVQRFDADLDPDPFDELD